MITDETALRDALARPAQPAASPHAVPRTGAQDTRKPAQGVREERAEERAEEAQGLPIPARVAAGALLCVFGAIGWVWGAYCTLRGWVLALNAFADVLGIPTDRRLPTLVGITVGSAVAGAVLQAFYSVVEVYCRPRRHWYRAFGFGLTALLSLLWLVVIVTDTGSTLWHFLTPGRGAWEVTRWIASNYLLSGAASLVVTFAPEWAIISGLMLLSGRVGGGSYERRVSHRIGGRGAAGVRRGNGL